MITREETYLQQKIRMHPQMTPTSVMETKAATKLLLYLRNTWHWLRLVSVSGTWKRRRWSLIWEVSGCGGGSSGGLRSYRDPCTTDCRWGYDDCSWALQECRSSIEAVANCVCSRGAFVSYTLLPHLPCGAKYLPYLSVLVNFPNRSQPNWSQDTQSGTASLHFPDNKQLLVKIIWVVKIRGYLLAQMEIPCEISSEEKSWVFNKYCTINLPWKCFPGWHVTTIRYPTE